MVADTAHQPGMRIARYVGRLDGVGIDDQLSGPSTIAAFFDHDAGIIDDPVSFPWGSAERDDWRIPIVIDLRTCSDDDLTALLPVLDVLTPSDRAVVTDTQRRRVQTELALPDSSVLSEFPAEVETDLVERAPLKLREALLRSVLEPILYAELAAIAGLGEDATRPLTVIDVGDVDGWRASLVAKPHHYLAVRSAADLLPASGNIVMIGASDLIDATATAVLDALAPGGLLVCLLNADDVTTTSGTGASSVMTTLDAATGRQRTVEHVWGLHERPGRKTLGGVIAIRPLGRGISEASAA